MCYVRSYAFNTTTHKLSGEVGATEYFILILESHIIYLLLVYWTSMDDDSWYKNVGFNSSN